MDDAAFAALERRLAPVLAEGGRGVIDRHDVLDLLAECRSLRDFTPPALAALEHVSWVFECLENLRAEEGGDERLCRKLRGHLCRARGALLAALQARPEGAVPDHEGGDRTLGRVVADRAELELLRRPLDVSGLMTAAELEGLRRRMEGGLAGAGWSGDQCLRLLAHAESLGSLVRELYGVIADLHADDPGRQALLERGRAEGRQQALEVLREHRGVWQHRSTDERLKAGPVRGLDGLEEKLKALGPCRPPPPPHAAEAEAGRLREALRAVVDGKDASYAAFCLAAEEARKVLVEGGAP